MTKQQPGQSQPAGAHRPGAAQRLRQWVRRLLGRTRFDTLERMLVDHGKAREAAFQKLRAENEGLRQRLEVATAMVEEVASQRLQPLMEASEKHHRQLLDQHSEVQQLHADQMEASRGLLAAQGRSAKELEEAYGASIQKMMASFQRQLEGVKQESARAVSAHLQEIKELTGELRSQVHTISEEVSEDTRQLGREIRGAVAEGMSTTAGSVDALSSRLDGLEQQLVQSTQPLDAVGSQLAEMRGPMDQLLGRFQNLSEQVDAMTPRLNGMRQQMVKDVLEPMQERLEQMGTQMKAAFGEDRDRLEHSLERSEHQGQQLGEERDRLREELESARQELAAVYPAVAARDELEHELEGAREALTALQQDFGESQEAISTFRRWRDSMQVELDRIRGERDRLLQTRVGDVSPQAAAPQSGRSEVAEGKLEKPSDEDDLGTAEGRA